MSKLLSISIISFLVFVNFINAQAVYNGSNKHIFTTNYGKVEIGPFNTSWAHIYTDRSKFIFNKDVYTITNAFSSYNNDLIFKTEGNERMRINDDTGYVGIGTSSPQSPLHIVSDYDAIQTFQTTDDKWLYTNWKSSNGSRRAYMGLDNTLNEFRLGVENGTNEIILTGGNVGVGTYNPSSKLHVAGSGRTGLRIGGPNTSSGAISDLIFIPSNGGKIGQANYWNWSFRTDSWANTSGDMVLYSHNGSSYTSPIIVQSDGDVSLVTGKGSGRNGNVGVGTLNPDSKLTVKGKIHAEEVKVDLSVPGPDYVFKEDYDLNTLEEVQRYIKENGHLPNIPSAKEMEENGVELGILNMKLLEKIEELTLYTLEQENRIKELELYKNKMEALERKIQILINKN